MRPVVTGETAWLFVGQALQVLPVALLLGESTPQLHNSSTSK
jgi:hypothetical protein